MFSCVASGIFAVRNADKTRQGDVGRGAVTYGQTAGLVQEIAKYDGIVSKTARSALSVFSDLAKESKAFEYAGKATNFAINNVNPLICVSGVVKTATSDDKIKTGITEAVALSTMFAGEAVIKHCYDNIVNSQNCKNILEKAKTKKVLKPVFEYLSKHNLNGKAATIVKGLTFVAGSITSYTVGQKMGDELASRVKANIGAGKKIDQKA